MAAGHRTLLFSQSRVMLDVIAAALAARGVPFLRIDGAVASAADRQVRCPARRGGGAAARGRPAPGRAARPPPPAAPRPPPPPPPPPGRALPVRTRCGSASRGRVGPATRVPAPIDRRAAHVRRTVAAKDGAAMAGV